MRRTLVVLSLVASLLVVALGAQAGLYVGGESLLTSEFVGAHATPVDSANQCDWGMQVGAAAVDVTPGVKQPDGSYLLWQEPYADINGNGVYDAPDPIEQDLDADLFTDTNNNGKWDGPFMAGYGHDKEPGGYYTAVAVHDPVWARAVAITCGGFSLALVSVDTVGLFRDFVKEVRRDAPSQYSHVVVASTHTHDSIDTMGLWGPSIIIDGKDPRTMKHYHDGVVKALRDAYNTREEVASVRAGSGVTRDHIPAAGTVQTDLRDPFVIDDRVVALQFVDAEGNTIATIVNWSPHPETLAGTVGEISSDYPHWLRKAIETDGATVGGVHREPLGGTAVFFSGAVGGMMTTLGAKPKDENGVLLPDHSYAKAARIGEVAAWVALDSLASATPVAPDGLRTQARLVTTPADNAFLFALNSLGVLDHGIALYSQEIGGLGPLGNVPPIPMLRTETNVITLEAGGADLLQILTIPGELLPEVALGNPLGTDPEASDAKCFALVPDKLLFNGAREPKLNPATGNREPGYARVLAAKPAYPKEPAIATMATGQYVMMFGLANDELGYIVPANDYELFTLFPNVYDHGRDRCGDDDHYEETNSGSSLLAPVVANSIAQMLDPTFVPAPLPPATSAGGFDPETMNAWVDTSRSGGYEKEEDAHVQAGGMPALPPGGCWGFVNGHGQDQGQEPNEETHGLWLDMDGDCAVSARDAIVFEDFWAQSEGQPYWRP